MTAKNLTRKRKKESFVIMAQTPGLKAFWQEARKWKPMTKDEERIIFEKYSRAKGGERDKILKEIVMRNQRLVYSNAAPFSEGDPDRLLDFISEGNGGLIEAARRFDVSRGFRFETFASDYIHREMFEYASQDARPVRRSNDLKIGYRLKKIKEEFVAENYRDPSLDELAEILENRYDMPVTNRLDLIDITYNMIDSPAVDQEASEAEAGEFAVLTASVNDFEKKCDEEARMNTVGALLKTLNERDREVVKMAYGIGYEYAADADDIAERFHLTRVRVNQIIVASIKAMKAASTGLSRP